MTRVQQHEYQQCGLLKTQINKTDRNDARGIAQMMRAGRCYRQQLGA
jgi:hypothetical protein